jgi:hypothetical protein
VRAFTLTNLAVVGEPDAATRVEDEVVGSHERMAVALLVEDGRLAGDEVDPLDAAARVVGGLERRADRETGDFKEVEAAAVAHVRRAIGADREPVGTPPQLGDHLHRAVGHRHRALGELESGRDLRDVHAPARPPS